MDFGSYTIPGIATTVAIALYCWQEPRLRGLEQGRKNRLQKKVNDLFNPADIETAKTKVLGFLDEGYADNNDLLMPIQKFLPYPRIMWFLSFAWLFATISALFHAKLSNIYVVNSQMFSLSVDDLVISVMVFLCALPSKWLYDEFRYMKRIINLFDT